MTHNFYQMTEDEFYSFIYNLLAWLSVVENRNKAPDITDEDVTDLNGLFTSYAHFYDLDVEGQASESDILRRQHLRSDITKWLKERFTPAIYDNMATIKDADLARMGYRLRKKESVAKKVTFDAPILHVISDSGKTILIHPYQKRGRKGKPAHATYMLLQQCVIHEGQAVARCTPDAKHEDDMKLGEEHYRQSVAEGHDISHSPQWETIGIYTDVLEGIVLHYLEDEIALPRLFRAFWGCKRGISEPSEVW